MSQPWAEKYRPKTLDGCILPANIRSMAEGMIKKDSLPNLLLSGPPGTGKTTLARVLAHELGYDVMLVNASNEGRLIDTLRTKIQNYASSVSFSGSRKMIILDECLEENEKVRVGTVDSYTTVPLKDLLFGVEYEIVSFNMTTGEMENDTGRLVSHKEDEIFEIELDDGRTIRANSEHPFLVKDKETGNIIQRKLKDLTDTDEIVSC